MKLSRVILSFVFVAAIGQVLDSGRAHAEESYAAIGFGGALPPSTRKFSFSELKKKVENEVPTDTPAPATPPDASEIVVDHRVPMPVAGAPVQTATRDSDPALQIEHYVKTFSEYEDFKDLVKTLPKGTKPEDVANDLAQLRVYGIGLGEQDLKTSLKNLVEHTGKLTNAIGELDIDKVDALFSSFDIERTLRVNRAVLDLQRQMAEQVRLSRAPLFGYDFDKVAAKGR